MPAISTILFLACRPRITRIEDGGTPRARARRATTAVFAAPATGGAVTRSRSVASCQPTTSSRAARGCTRSDSSAPSGLGVVLVLAELGRHHPVVALERRAEILDELAADAPERLDLAPDPRLLGPALLDDLLAPQLGLPHLQLRLAPGGRLHFLAEPARPLLEGRDLLLELRVLLEHRFVVLGDVVEEGVDLVGVEAPQQPDGELLLADIQRADAHRRLASYPISVAIRYSTGT